MTFEQWWAEIEAAVPMTEREKVNLRVAQLGCWNAAIEEARRWMAQPHERTEQTDLMAHALSRTPINGMMHKNSQ